MATTCQSPSLFSNAIQALFNNWTALQLAVQHQLGGASSKEIAVWMVETVEQYFNENDNLDGDEVAGYIGAIMDNEFNTLIEDGSLEEIGEKLCSYYKKIKLGQESDVIKELQKLKPSCGAAQSIKKDPVPLESEPMDLVNPMNDLSVETNPRKPKNEPDEDGWITVTKGKK